MTIGQYPNAEEERKRVDDPSLATELARERLDDMAPPAHLEPPRETGQPGEEFVQGRIGGVADEREPNEHD